MAVNPIRPISAYFDQGQVPTIGCVNIAETALGVEWPALVTALQNYTEIFAKVWGTPAKIVDCGHGPVPAGQWGLVFLDDADAANALGYHDLTEDGLPLSKIFVRTTIADGEQVSVTASHELAEMLVDPGIQMGALGPDGTTWYAYETADAVERESFEINGIAMSNFVYPAWFEGFRAPRSARFDHLRTCQRAFQIRPGGYMPVFRNGRWSQIFGSVEAEEYFNATTHLRTELRGRVMRHYSGAPLAEAAE